MPHLLRAVAVSALCIAVPLHAQDVSGPVAGTWAAEASTTTSASLLRFRSPSSAWVLNVALAYQRREEDQPTGLPTFDTDASFFTSDVRIGIRSYRRVPQRVRPFTTVSAVVGFEDSNFSTNGWRFGAALELGASYFFSPHLSMGVSNALVATYQFTRRDLNGETLDGSIVTATLGGFRLLGAVYF